MADEVEIVPMRGIVVDGIVYLNGEDVVADLRDTAACFLAELPDAEDDAEVDYLVASATIFRGEADSYDLFCIELASAAQADSA